MDEWHDIPEYYDAIWDACDAWSNKNDPRAELVVDMFSDSGMPPDGGNFRVKWRGDVVFWGYNKFRDMDDADDWDHRTCYVYKPGEWESILRKQTATDSPIQPDAPAEGA